MLNYTNDVYHILLITNIIINYGVSIQKPYLNYIEYYILELAF